METKERTEGQRILAAARELLETVPPDDRLAHLAGCYAELIKALEVHFPPEASETH